MIFVLPFFCSEKQTFVPILAVYLLICSSVNLSNWSACYVYLMWVQAQKITYCILHKNTTQYKICVRVHVTGLDKSLALHSSRGTDSWFHTSHCYDTDINMCMGTWPNLHLLSLKKIIEQFKKEIGYTTTAYFHKSHLHYHCPLVLVSLLRYSQWLSLHHGWSHWISPSL